MMQTGVCFFFSSRRRHTRCSRDWSSDVCSSDLRTWGGRAVHRGVRGRPEGQPLQGLEPDVVGDVLPAPGEGSGNTEADRKSTRLNSSHGYISYAVFCLKKKKKTNRNINDDIVTQ